MTQHACFVASICGLELGMQEKIGLWCKCAWCRQVDEARCIFSWWHHFNHSAFSLRPGRTWRKTWHGVINSSDPCSHNVGFSAHGPHRFHSHEPDMIASVHQTVYIHAEDFFVILRHALIEWLTHESDSHLCGSYLPKSLLWLLPWYAWYAFFVCAFSSDNTCTTDVEQLQQQHTRLQQDMAWLKVLEEAAVDTEGKLKRLDEEVRWLVGFYLFLFRDWEWPENVVCRIKSKKKTW